MLPNPPCPNLNFGVSGQHAATRILFSSYQSQVESRASRMVDNQAMSLTAISTHAKVPLPPRLTPIPFFPACAQPGPAFDAGETHVITLGAL